MIDQYKIRCIRSLECLEILTQRKVDSKLLLAKCFECSTSCELKTFVEHPTQGQLHLQL